jgi:hypothetical protein
MVALYLLAAAIIFRDHVETERFIAAPAQLGASTVIALALAVAAFAIPRRSASSPGRVPPPWLIGCGGVAALATYQLLPPTWVGVAVDVLVLALLGAMLLHGRGVRPGVGSMCWRSVAPHWWSARLVLRGRAAGQPLPDTQVRRQLGDHAGRAGAALWASHRLHRAETSARTEGRCRQGRRNLGGATGAGIVKTGDIARLVRQAATFGVVVAGMTAAGRCVAIHVPISAIAPPSISTTEGRSPRNTAAPSTAAIGAT